VFTSPSRRNGNAACRPDSAAPDVSQKQASLLKFDRDYESGDLSAHSYERLVKKVSEELVAAEAEHQRLTAHGEQIAGTLNDLDAEHETLRRLAVLRAAVAQRMQSVGGT